jgi:Ribonuclease G/E
MAATLFVDAGPGETRLAVMADGALVAAEVHRTGAPDRVDEIHLARIGPRATGASGWFVHLADTQAFLPQSEVPPARRNLAEGAAIVVRISRAAMGGKGVRVSMKRVPEPPAGLVAPTRLAAAPDPVVRLAASHAARIVHGFPPEAEDAFAALLLPDIPLPAGGVLHIHPTPAATLVDVDAGGQPAEAANAAAVAAVARQVVLRNLSGVILVDFAALEGRAARAAVMDRLRAALAGDPLRAEVTGHSPAGLVEVVRRRIRPPLHALMCDAAPPFQPSALTLGLAALRMALAEAMARPAMRPALRAHPRVLTSLQAEGTALAAFAARAGAPLLLRADPAVAPAASLVEDARDGR